MAIKVNRVIKMEVIVKNSNDFSFSQKLLIKPQKICKTLSWDRIFAIENYFPQMTSKCNTGNHKITKRNLTRTILESDQNKHQH
jgi:hypothetical protein